MTSVSKPYAFYDVVRAVRRIADADPAASHHAVPHLCRRLEKAPPSSKAFVVGALGEVACRNAGDSEEVAILLLKLLPDERPKPLSAGRHPLYLIARHQPSTLGRIIPIVLEMLSEPEPVSTAAGEALSAIADGVHARISGKTDIEMTY